MSHTKFQLRQAIGYHETRIQQLKTIRSVKITPHLVDRHHFAAEVARKLLWEYDFGLGAVDGWFGHLKDRDARKMHRTRLSEYLKRKSRPE